MGFTRGTYTVDAFDCIHGHFQKRKYDSWNRDFITSVRSPVERTISSYYKALTKNKGRRDPHQIRLKVEKLSLIEYAEMKANEMTEVYFNNASPADFAFIGITEQYKRSIERFEDYIGVQVKKYDKKNITKTKDFVSAKERQIIAEIMSKDMEFYNEVLRRTK